MWSACVYVLGVCIWRTEDNSVEQFSPFTFTWDSGMDLGLHTYSADIFTLSHLTRPHPRPVILPCCILG